MTSPAPALSSAPTNAPSTNLKTPSPHDTYTYTAYSTPLEPIYLPLIRQLISRDLSEPYSIYVYRYFLYQWADLCLMCVAQPPEEGAPPQLIGVIINKLEPHGQQERMRGYIAMLAVQKEYRGRGIAGKLVRMAVEAMKGKGADEIALETEVDNVPSLKLYERLGFLRSKRLHRYYLNGNGAFRLILNLTEKGGEEEDKVPPGTAASEKLARSTGISAQKTITTQPLLTGMRMEPNRS